MHSRVLGGGPVVSPKLEMNIYIVDPSKPLSDESLDYLDNTELPTITFPRRGQLQYPRRGRCRSI